MSWLGSWKNRRKITISQTKVDAALFDFPIFLKLSANSGIGSVDITDIFAKLGSDANRKKIAITTSDGVTQCYAEIENWNNANNLSSLWVKVPTVTSGADTELYIYYDPAQPDNTQYIGDTESTAGQTVWDSNFELVLHMAQDPDGDVANAIKDSTANNRHATPGGSMTSADLIDDQIGKGLKFDGDDYLTIPNISTLNNTDLTIEKVFNFTTADNNKYLLHHGDSAVANNQGLGVIISDASKIYLKYFNGSWRYIYSDSSLSVGQNSIAVVYDKTAPDATFYFSGNADTVESMPAVLPTTDYSLKIAVHKGAGLEFFFENSISEIRISSIQRTAAWLKATHHSNWDSLVTYSITVESGNMLLVTLPMIEASIIEKTLLMATLPAITAEFHGGGGGFLETTLPVITADFHGGGPNCRIATTLPAIAVEIKGASGGFLEAALPAITAEIQGGALLEATLPAITASLEGDVEILGDLIVFLPATTASLEGKVDVHGDLVCMLPAITAELTGTVEMGGSLVCTLPMITAVLNGFQDISGDLVATLPMITALIEGTTGMADDDGDPIDADECGIILRYSKVGY